MHEALNWIIRRIDRIEDKLNRIGAMIMAMEDDILAELEAAKTEQAGFLVLLKALRDNQGNPAKLQAIAASVGTNRQAWVEAFRENVPNPDPAPPVA